MGQNPPKFDYVMSEEPLNTVHHLGNIKENINCISIFCCAGILSTAHASFWSTTFTSFELKS